MSQQSEPLKLRVTGALDVVYPATSGEKRHLLTLVMDAGGIKASIHLTPADTLMFLLDMNKVFEKEMQKASEELEDLLKLAAFVPVTVQ